MEFVQRLNRRSYYYRTNRLKRERNALLTRRRRVVDQVCTAVKKTLPLLQWNVFPPFHELYDWEGFSVLINDPSPSELEPQGCARVLEAFPSFIAARRDNIRNALLEKLPLKFIVQTASVGTDTVPDPLSLVTATFETPRTYCILHTLNDVLAYPSYDYLYGDPTHVVRESFVFSQAGHDVVVSLLSLLGLDMHTATPVELDRLDARFVCMRCPADLNAVGVKFRYAYDWRQRVQNCVKYEGTVDHSIPEWILLNADNSRLVKMQNNSPNSWPSWSCAHCSSHFENAVKRPCVVPHVQQTHNVPEPVEDVDFFHIKPLSR